MTFQMPKVVINTTPLLSLLLIDKLYLLKKLYKQIIIPQAVYEEIEYGKDKKYYTDLQKIEYINILKIKDVKALNYFMDLHSGEAEVIVLANEIDADLVIIDETLGRRFAKNAGLKVTETIGVLIKAKEQGHINEVMPLLNEMKDNGVWFSNKLLDTIRHLVNE